MLLVEKKDNDGDDDDEVAFLCNKLISDVYCFGNNS